MPFQKANPKQSFPELEEEILTYWQANRIFEESVERDAKKGEFVFYDGPPFATGLPHYGHILQGVIKDMIPRFKTMQGYRVPRVWGWDCHGLPVENLIEKELNLGSKDELEKFGIGKFNEACRSSVLRYAEEWKKTVARMGRWIDMENDYKTMNPEFMDSVWWVFGQLWEKGLVYEGLKPMHICPRCVTPLSNFEVGLGYKDVTDLSVIAKFEMEEEENTYLLAWTTTPWTLPGNVALAVNPEVEYAKVKTENGIFILAKKLVEKTFGESEHEIVGEISGKEFIGKTYRPLFDYFADKKSEGAFRVVAGDFVGADDGTGIVHIAPAFGDDDYQLSKTENLPVIQHVGMDGKFKSEVTDFAGVEVKPADDPAKTDRKISEFLEKADKLFEAKNYRHSYAHCWRCDTPLLNYATSSWFVAVEKIKDQLLTNNQKINWTPEHIRDGRFGKWLEGARDWAISRSRYWGAPLPVWRCDSCGQTHCVSGREELEKLSGEKVDDLHKHFVDEITFPCQKCAGKMTRIPEVFDCWFESGSMPYAQFATKEKTVLPADFIAEAQDQTRGWFYTLHVLATALQDQPAFANCICSGLVLAEDGQKMSKSKKNYPDPQKIFDGYGADAMRLYLISSPVVRAEALRFSERGVEETLRSVLLPLWNTHYFFTTYALADGWEVTELPEKLDNKLDRWVLSELNLLTREMTDRLEKYELQDAVRPLSAFLDSLTNWYIRRSRRRFWKSENDGDKEQAYATLFHVLKEVAKLLAPVCPFLAEKIYRDLTGEKSVHLEAWPQAEEKWIDEKLSEEVSHTRKIISLGLKIRAQENLKIRQPLEKASVVRGGIIVKGANYDFDTIKEELNLKNVEFCSDNAEFIEGRIAKINPRIVGKKFPQKIQEMLKAGKNREFEEMKLEFDGNNIPIPKIKICEEVLENEEFEIQTIGRSGYAVESDGQITVALDTQITPELELEGRARDLVRAIQDLRKTADYEVSDRIYLQLEGAEDVLEAWQEYIAGEVLAESVVEQIDQPDQQTEIDDVKIGVKKV